MEADYQRFYGLDLRCAVEADGCRRTWALVRGLPRDAATWREDGAWWSQETELAAAQIEVADRWGRAMAQLLGAKPSALPPPIEIKRPTTERPRPRSSWARRLAAQFREIGRR